MPSRVKNPALCKRPRLLRKCKILTPHSSVKRVTLDLLPDDILLHIFSYVSTYDLFKNVRLVCKRFHGLALSQPLWQNMAVSETVPYCFIHKWMYRFGPYLRHFSTECRTDANRLLAQLTKHCKNIETINLVNCMGSDGTTIIHSRKLINLVIRCKKLRRINLSQCRFGSCKFFKILPIGAANGVRKFKYTGPMSSRQMKALLDSLDGQTLDENATIGNFTVNKNFKLTEIMNLVSKNSAPDTIVNKIWRNLNSSSRVNPLEALNPDRDDTDEDWGLLSDGDY